MGSAVQEWGSFADAQESRFQASKSSEMCSGIAQVGRNFDAQESRIQVAECSNKFIAGMKGLRFADSQ